MSTFISFENVLETVKRLVWNMSLCLKGFLCETRWWTSYKKKFSSQYILSHFMTFFHLLVFKTSLAPELCRVPERQENGGHNFNGEKVVGWIRHCLFSWMIISNIINLIKVSYTLPIEQRKVEGKSTYNQSTKVWSKDLFYGAHTMLLVYTLYIK